MFKYLLIFNEKRIQNKGLSNDNVFEVVIHFQYCVMLQRNIQDNSHNNAMTHSRKFFFFTKIKLHSQPHKYVNTFFFWRKIRNDGRVGIGDKHVLFREGNDTASQAEYSPAISLCTQKGFTVQFHPRIKLSLYLVKSLLLLTIFKGKL